MDRPTFVVIDGKVAATRRIATGKHPDPPGLILLGKEQLLARFVVQVYKKGFEVAVKTLAPADLKTIRETMNELIKNGYRILGSDGERLRIGLEVLAEGEKLLPTMPEDDDIEAIEGVPVSKKGMDGLGKLFGSRAIAEMWVQKMIWNIRAKEEVPF